MTPVGRYVSVIAGVAMMGALFLPWFTLGGEKTLGPSNFSTQWVFGLGGDPKPETLLTSLAFPVLFAAFLAFVAAASGSRLLAVVDGVIALVIVGFYLAAQSGSDGQSDSLFTNVGAGPWLLGVAGIVVIASGAFLAIKKTSASSLVVR